jgi:hypothetical protein
MHTALASSGRLAAMLRSTMWVASGLAIVRSALVLFVGFPCCQAILVSLPDPEYRSELAPHVGIMLVMLSPIVIGAYLTYSARAALRGRAHALPMLRLGYAAGLLDALVWAGVGLYVALRALDSHQEDPSIGICVLPTLGAAGVRGLMSAATVGFYVTAWQTVEQPEHKAWLSGAPR